MDKEKKERERGRETRMTTSRTKSSKNVDKPTDNELYSRFLVVIKTEYVCDQNRESFLKIYFIFYVFMYV